MHEMPSFYQRFLVVVLWLLVLCLAAHFIHDLQPGLHELAGVAVRACQLAIHSGALGGAAPAIVLALLIAGLAACPPLVNHPGARPVPLPPPIRG